MQFFVRFVDSAAWLCVIGNATSGIIGESESQSVCMKAIAPAFHHRGIGMPPGCTPFSDLASLRIAGAWAAFVLAGLLGAANCCAEEADAAVGSPRVSFNDDIRPIFAKHCVGCHGGVKQASGLSFIYRETALAEAAERERDARQAVIDLVHFNRSRGFAVAGESPLLVTRCHRRLPSVLIHQPRRHDLPPLLLDVLSARCGVPMPSPPQAAIRTPPRAAA